MHCPYPVIVLQDHVAYSCASAPSASSALSGGPAPVAAENAAGDKPQTSIGPGAISNMKVGDGEEDDGAQQEVDEEPQLELYGVLDRRHRARRTWTSSSMRSLPKAVAHTLQAQANAVAAAELYQPLCPTDLLQLLPDFALWLSNLHRYATLIYLEAFLFGRC